MLTFTQKRWAERGGIAAAALALGYVFFGRRGGHGQRELRGHVEHRDHDENERGEYGHKKHKHHHHED